MVDITPILKQGAQRIDGYGNGGFTISGKRYEGSLIVFPDEVLPWDIGSNSDNIADTLMNAEFDLLFTAKNKPELVLIGCGGAFASVPVPLRQKFREHDIAVDSMDTGAACRTYNVLLAEERLVAAILLAI